MESKLRELILSKLNQGMPGLTSAQGSFLMEACAVSLEEQNHVDGVELTVDGSFNTLFVLRVPEVTSQMRRGFGDLDEAVEYGATAIAILVVQALTDLKVVRRMYKGPGFDYWLGSDGGNSDHYLQEKSRLEVSGILKGTNSQIKSRIKQKLEQTAPSDNWGYPAYIVVVEFSNPLAKVEKK